MKLNIKTAADLAADALAEAQTVAHATLLNALDAAAMSITGPVPLAEQLSWTAKEAAARAVLDTTSETAQTAMLQGEAEQTGEDIADLAARIVTNADAYRAASALMAGLRRKTVVLIDAAATPADVADAMISFKTGLSALA